MSYLLEYSFQLYLLTKLTSLTSFPERSSGHWCFTISGDSSSKSRNHLINSVHSCCGIKLMDPASGGLKWHSAIDLLAVSLRGQTHLSVLQETH